MKRTGASGGSRWAGALGRLGLPRLIPAKLRKRPDCERDLALYRIWVGGLAGGYLLAAMSLVPSGSHAPVEQLIWLLAGFAIFSLSILGDALLRPGAQPARRVAGILLDAGALSWCLHLGGETALPLYPLYLIAVLASGLRFGTRYLLAAAGIAAAGIALVTVTTPFFAGHLALSFGLLGGLVLPALQICAAGRVARRDPHPGKFGGRPEQSAARKLSPIPLRTVPASAAAAHPGLSKPGSNAPDDLAANEPPMRRLTILVAEDNPTTQKVIAKVLEHAGHASELVSDGQAAAEAVAKDAFDLVLMDLEMPVLNGIEATKLIRFLSTGRSQLPIIGLAADADEFTRRRWEDAGVDAWLAKPIDPAGLLRAVEDASSLGHRVRLLASAAAGEAANPAAPNGRPAPLDLRTLESLKALGGEEFVEELAQQFVDDASGVLRDLAHAAEAGDVHEFREQAHALRSGAANLGAQGIYEMCLAWRGIEADTLSSKGASYLEELEREFDRVRTALQDYRQHGPTRKQPVSVHPAGDDAASLGA